MNMVEVQGDLDGGMQPELLGAGRLSITADLPIC
jgi:hypothetical protein